MVAKEMKQQDFLFSLPTIKIVNAESSEITMTSTGKCSTTLIMFMGIFRFKVYIAYLFFQRDTGDTPDLREIGKKRNIFICLLLLK